MLLEYFENSESSYSFRISLCCIWFSFKVVLWCEAPIDFKCIWKVVSVNFGADTYDKMWCTMWVTNHMNRYGVLVAFKFEFH